MLLVVLVLLLVIDGTDILFALDSTRLIFGLAENVFLVFTATVFSLPGLRQLYFLIDGLLECLLYLSWSLALILGFIGIKPILHALHEQPAFRQRWRSGARDGDRHRHVAGG